MPQPRPRRALALRPGPAVRPRNAVEERAERGEHDGDTGEHHLPHEDARYRSNVWHALAAAQAAVGNPEEAERHYRLALEDLERLKQWREASQVGRELSQVLRKLGRDDDAYGVLDRASLLTVRHLGVAQGRLREPDE